MRLTKLQSSKHWILNMWNCIHRPVNIFSWATGRSSVWNHSGAMKISWCLYNQYLLPFIFIESQDDTVGRDFCCSKQSKLWDEARWHKALPTQVFRTSKTFQTTFLTAWLSWWWKIFLVSILNLFYCNLGLLFLVFHHATLDFLITSQ